MTDPGQDTTALIEAMRRGEPGSAEIVYTKLYDALREIARGWAGGESPGHRPDPSSLVNAAFVKLFGSGELQDVSSRKALLALASTAMVRILVDRARARAAEKRGGGKRDLPIDAALDTVETRDLDIVQLQELLEKLREHDEEAYAVFAPWYLGIQTLKKLADWYGEPIHLIKKRRDRAKEFLRGLMGDHPEPEQ